MLKISVKGSQDGSWGLTQGYKKKGINYHEAIESWLAAHDYVPAEKIAAVTALYNEIGVGKRCQEKAEALNAEGFGILDSINLPEERKAVLREYACSMLNRNV